MYVIRKYVIVDDYYPHEPIFPRRGKTAGLTTGQPDNQRAARGILCASRKCSRVRSIDGVRSILWMERSVWQRDECDTDRSRGERARRDWLHVSGMPRIRGVALWFNSLPLGGIPSSSSALCPLYSYAAIMIGHIRIPDPGDIDGEHNLRHRSRWDPISRRETVTRSLEISRTDREKGKRRDFCEQEKLRAILCCSSRW